MKNLINITTCSLLLLILCSCKKEEKEQLQPIVKTPEATVPLSGHYVWKFTIPDVGDQESHLVFYMDSVGYVMTGPAYSTIYTMIQESYTEENNEKRWIGIGRGGSIPKDDKYFVMFFKEITDSTVLIYKHECNEGKTEAETFPYPSDDATADHGWNLYRKL